MSGNFGSESTSDFVRELSQHARSSHHRAETATRTASAVSVGEVQSRLTLKGNRRITSVFFAGVFKPQQVPLDNLLLLPHQQNPEHKVHPGVY